MNRILPGFIVALFLLASAPSNAQLYITEQFTDVTVTKDVKYGENYSVLTGAPVLEDLVMDVYEPTGSTATDRYLVILMHAGSYLPKGVNTLPFGNKEDSAMVSLCTSLAKRGWVAASINYRLGWNPAAPSEEDRASGIINAVYRSMHDAKTCIRYFRKDAATTDTYRIDPERVVVGGSNSGGYTALASGVLDRIEETQLLKFLDGQGDSFIDTASTGGFEGEGGNPALNVVNHTGYASNPQLVLNMGGATGDLSWHEAGDAPIVNFHGVVDPLTPYNTAVVIVASTQQAVVEVSGSLDIAETAQDLGNSDVFIDANFTDVYTQRAEAQTSFEGLFPFTGLANGFEPWAWYDSNDMFIDNTTPGATGFGSAANPFANKTKALAYQDTILGYFTPRAVEALTNPIPLDLPLSAQELAQPKNNVKISPVPATTEINVLSAYSKAISAVSLTDLTGRVVRSESGLRTNNYTVSRQGLPAGIYLLNIQFGDEQLVEKVVFN